MLKSFLAGSFMLLLVIGPLTVLEKQNQVGLLKLMMVDEMSDPLNTQEDNKTKWSEDWVAEQTFTLHLLPHQLFKHITFDSSSFLEEIFLEVKTPPPLV